METVNSDLKKYLQKNIFPSRTVLVFPPFNGFRRFLIHKLIEDNFASSEVAAFSIGQDISRRIVVCYKGLIREGQNKGTPVTKKSQVNMIEKDRQSRQKPTPTAAVYRPPAARIAESRQSTEDLRSSHSKQNRVRRPDQQVYVPRPKRASYGNEQPRSRSRSSSRTSLESDSFDKRNKFSLNKSEDSRIPGSNEINCVTSDKYKTHSIGNQPNSMDSACKKDDPFSHSLSISASSSTMKDVPIAENTTNAVINRPREIPIITDLKQPSPSISASSVDMSNEVSSIITTSDKVMNPDTTEQQMRELHWGSSIGDCIKIKTPEEIQVDSPKSDTTVVIENKQNYPKSDTSIVRDEVQCQVKSISEVSRTDKPTSLPSEQDSSSDISEKFENRKVDSVEKVDCSKVSELEIMETISISSNSRDDDQSSNSFMSLSSSNSSRSNDSSSDSDAVLTYSRHKNCENMEIEHSINSGKKNFCSTDRSNSKDHNIKNRRIFPNLSVSDVLIISDTSSTDDTASISQEHEINKDKLRKPYDIKKQDEKPVKKSKLIDLNECDWESLYDDSGDCLVPNLMEELTNSVGKVRITSVDNDYRPYQSVEERTNDGECIIEIYDFPAEFKTTDLFNIFAAYRSKNFQIKWVDDTHALGVFPSPLMADEVLACTLPFVKTRPLRLGITESRNKARSLVLPPLPSMERPKTCTALARRLVSGALGLRLPTSSQEREREKQVLKEAREKRRLEAKQKEAAWDGSLTSNSCI